MMNLDVLRSILNYYHNIDRLPIVLYDKTDVIDRFISHPEVLKLHTETTRELLQSKHPFHVVIVMNYIAYYKINIDHSSYQLLVGPLPLKNISNAMIRAYMVEYNCPLEYYENIQDFYNFTPVHTYSHYQAKLNLLFISLNHRTLDSVENVINEAAITDVTLSRIKQSFSESEEHNAPKKTKLLSFEYEKKMLYYIENGMIEQMDKFEKSYYAGDVKVISEDPLRNSKLSLATMNSLCVRAAIRGGVNFDVAYEMGDFFSVAIENAKRLEELSPISYAVRRDYCRKVYEVKQTHIEDTSIRKCIAYINQNITKNFTIQELADHVGFSKSYLSSKFAQVVGKTFSQYLVESKMNVAKELLVLTDRTIVDISFFLSFSSQSYFNNKFKKIVGITPQQYRMKHTLGNSVA